MNREQFLAAHQPVWDEMEELLRSLRRGRLRFESTAQLERSALLYRRCASDLAVCRREFPFDPMTDYLNGLCGRIHPHLTASDPAQLRPLHYYAVTVPQRWRAAWAYLLVTAALAGAAVLVGYLVTAADIGTSPGLAASLLSQSLFGLEIQGVVSSADINPALAALSIILNNMLVSITVLLGGVTGGLLTAYAITGNFWQIGVLGAAAHANGVDYVFWSYLASHGVIELSVIIVAGACGLRIADSLLRPGVMPRTESLQHATLDAAVLGGGMITVLVVCGTLEGFLSPSTVNPAVKYAVGLGSGILLYTWLLLGGRKRRHRQPLILEGDHAGVAEATV